MNVSTLRGAGRAWVEVNLANLVANARAIQEVAGGASLLPMVKADAYGLGAVRVARALESLAPWGYGVATLDEAIELRAAGIGRPVVVFTPARIDHLEAYHAHDLTAVLDDPDAAALWDRPFHLEIDTGMGRCGVRWDAWPVVARFVSRHLEGAFTHLYAADVDPESAANQVKRFHAAIGQLGSRPSLLHVANSAGLWRLVERFDLVRPGLFLYGGRPGPDLPIPRPVATVRARVVSVRELPPGASVSYGGDWTAVAATRVATVAIGYADGIPRSVQSRAAILLGGVRRPVVGRVTMDFVMADVGPGSDVAPGDVATIIGSDGREVITLDEFSGWASTVSYEILTRLGRRLSREYVE